MQQRSLVHGVRYKKTTSHHMPNPHHTRPTQPQDSLSMELYTRNAIRDRCVGQVDTSMHAFGTWLWLTAGREQQQRSSHLLGLPGSLWPCWGCRHVLPLWFRRVAPESVCLQGITARQLQRLLPFSLQLPPLEHGHT